LTDTRVVCTMQTTSKHRRDTMELLGALLGWLFNWSHDPNDPSEHGNDDAYPFRDMREENGDDRP